MKKMLLATALALLITGSHSTDVYCSKQTAVSTENICIISSFLEIGRRKHLMQPKFVAAQKMLLKQKPSKHS